jgi:hypothetical protein
MSDPCAPIKKCRDATKELSDCTDPKDQIEATNPNCTDALQGSDPNNIPQCDSNMLADDAGTATITYGDNIDEKRMRAYSKSQNCQYVGAAATMTGGVNSGYNREAIMIGDMRGGKDGRGSIEKTSFAYPGSAMNETAPSDASGYPSEAHVVVQPKHTQAGKDQLRRQDINNLHGFNTNKNDARKEVTAAALLKDPVCGAIANNLNCSKQCDSLKRNECLALSSQCAFTDGYKCSKVIRSKKTCFNGKGNEIDCVKERDDVRDDLTKTIDTIEACVDGKGNAVDCTGLCHTYDPSGAVDGLAPIARKFTTKCYTLANKEVQCKASGSQKYADNVKRVRMTPTIAETCKTKDGATTPCRNEGKINENVYTMEVDDGNPFQKIRHTWNDNSKSFDVSRLESGKKTGECTYLEAEQLGTAFKCCSKEGKTNALTTYYNKKIGTEEKEKASAMLNRKVRLQAF